MVGHPLVSTQQIEVEETLGSEISWTSVPIGGVIDEGYRLVASVFGIDGRMARQELERCKWEIVELGNVFIENAFYLDRFKRVYVDKKDGIPFLMPSQISELNPRASKFISLATNVDIESTFAKKRQVLLTRSGTIGIVSFVSKTLEGQALSDDVIRIEVKEFPGYVYAFLKSRIGRLLVNTNNYGAVVSHIEPQHLNHIPIPNPSSIIKQTINGLIEDSFALRDACNALMNDAQVMLQRALDLPAIEELQRQAQQVDKKAGVLNFSIDASKLENRLDASFHVPVVEIIEKHLKQGAREIVRVSDPRISRSVIFPGRFKRVYVEEDRGVVFFGGKQLYELDPSNKKYLSLTHHGDRIKRQLTLRENMTLITCSGTIGKVAITPSHWDGWTANQHIIRVVPASDDIAGYLYAWLSSDHAFPLLTRNTYGAVVDEVDDKQISETVLPLLRNEELQYEINNKVLEANNMASEAYGLERKALKILYDRVFYA